MRQEWNGVEAISPINWWRIRKEVEFHLRKQGIDSKRGEAPESIRGKENSFKKTCSGLSEERKMQGMLWSSTNSATLPSI